MVTDPQATLLVKGGPNSGAIVALVGGPVTIRRRSANDVVIDETTVSRRHSLIMETPDGYVVRDLNTTNGTYVNQNRLGQTEVLLRHGDQIRLGGSEVTIVFRQDGPNTLKMGTIPATEELISPIPFQPSNSAPPVMGEINSALLSALAREKGR